MRGSGETGSAYGNVEADGESAAASAHIELAACDFSS